MTERLWQEYEAFAGRDLSEFAIAYFFSNDCTNGGDFGTGRSDFGSLGFSGPIEGSSTPVPELCFSSPRA